MNNRIPILIAIGVLLIMGGIVFVVSSGGSSKSDTKNVVATPTPVHVEQLSDDDRPTVKLSFSADGHYVTLNVSNLKASSLEYSLIYDATVKKSQIQTGVSGSVKLEGRDSYSNRQLLGSESSGKFTYHEKIDNAVMELSLRNEAGYSIYTATYPFEIVSGQTVELTPAQ